MEIQAYSKNAKKHPDKQLRLIAASLKEYGWQQPIVTDAESTIIVGHGRYEAYQKYPEGISEPWIVVADKLTPEQVRGYRLMDNKSNESVWDMALALEELKELDNLGFDIELTGFDKDLLLEVDAQDDVLPENPPPVAQIGDLWALGEHRVLCGDSTNNDAVARLMGMVKPNLMVTDPPYGVSYDPEWRDGADLGVGERSKGKVMNDDRADWKEAYDLFTGNIAYVWHGGLHTTTVAQNLIDSGFSLRAQIIWVKHHFVMSRGDYHWQHEPCWYGVRNKGDWQGDRKQTTIWEIQNNNSFGRKGEAEETFGHGTQKPVECMLRPIVNNSNEGQVVYDPFLGSGTTLIAAEKTGRICYGMELDPKYVDVILKRWEQYSGKRAVKIV